MSPLIYQTEDEDIMYEIDCFKYIYVKSIPT